MLLRLFLTCALGAFALADDQSRIRNATVAAPPSGDCDADNVLNGGASDCPLLTWSDFTIEGYYKMPTDVFDDTLFYGGLAMKSGDPTNFWATTGFVVAEMEIPAIVNSGTIGSLNTATYAQSPTNVQLNGLSNSGLFCDDVDCENTTGAYISGILDSGSFLYAGGFNYFQAPAVDKGLFRFSRTLSSFSYPGAVKPWDGDGVVSITQAFVTQYCGHTPSEWQTALGAPNYCGASSSYPIITRTSNGPTVIMLDISQVNTTTVTGQGLMFYLDSSASATLGQYSGSLTPSVWSSSAGLGGCQMINLTRTMVCIGSNGTGTDFGTCYGTIPVPPGDCDIPEMVDNEYTGIAYHAPPYVYKYWLFDLNDLKAVKDGSKTAESVFPYANGTFTTDYPPARTRFVGTTYDPTNTRLMGMAMRTWGSAQKEYNIMVNWQVDITP